MARKRIFCGTKQEIADHVLAHAGRNDWILVKGSRGMAMETIIQHWESRMAPESRKTEKA